MGFKMFLSQLARLIGVGCVLFGVEDWQELKKEFYLGNQNCVFNVKMWEDKSAWAGDSRPGDVTSLPNRQNNG